MIMRLIGLNQGAAMLINNTFYYFLGILLLAGCAGNPLEKSTDKEAFVTHIKDDGSKMFTYGVSFELQQGQRDRANRDVGGMLRENSAPGGQNRGRNRGGDTNMVMSGGMRGSRGNSLRDNMLEVMTEKLLLKLANSGYCREGYMQLDEYVDRTSAQIKGECNESATEEDREKFAN